MNFRWIYDYSGGQVTDWGGHHPDCAQWGMGTEMTGPIEIRNAKGVFPARPSSGTRPPSIHFEAVYDNGVTMIVSNKEKMGVTLEGTEGKIYANRGTLRRQPQIACSTPRSGRTRSTFTRATTTFAISSTA